MIFYYILILIMPLAHHPIWTGVWGELTLVKYLGALCLFFTVIYVAIRRSFPPVLHIGPARWYLMFFLVACASYFLRGGQLTLRPSMFMIFFSFLLLFIITLGMVDSLSRLRWVLLVMVGSVGWASVYLLREYRWYYIHYGPSHRPGAVAGDPNYFTLSALLCLPLAFRLMQGHRPRWERLFCFACLVFTLFAVTLAASRGGFLGLGAGFLFLVWYSRHRVRNLALITALVLPLSLVSSISPLKRLLHPGHGDRESTENRIAVWKAGLRMVSENPLIGIGFGRFTSLLSQYGEPGETPEYVPHNTYLDVAAELGLLGLLPFLGMQFSTYRTLGGVARRTRLSGPPLLYYAATGLQAGLVGFAVAIFFISAINQKLFWLLLFLSMILPLLERGGRGHPHYALARTRQGA